MHVDQFPSQGKPDAKALQHLGKSIRKVGLLQSIAIERIEDNGQGQTFRVAAGRRRLRACRALIEKSIWPAETEIPTVIVDAQTAAKLRMMAMAENTMREAIHPVDAYEQVRDIMADGGDEQDAGEALGLTVLQIRQFEALGKIAPPILKDGELVIGQTAAILQYLAPTMQLLLGVWIFHETFGGARLFGFGVPEVHAKVFEVNAPLSAIDRAPLAGLQ